MKKLQFFLLLTLLAAGCMPDAGREPTPDFDVSAPGTTFFAEDPVRFGIIGDADVISFWSGETGNDYAWRETDRVYEGEGFLSFGTAFMNGAQWKNQASDDIDKKLLTFWWSDDFSGSYTAEAIAAATWHDATDAFSFASARVNDARVLSDATPSGSVALKDIIPATAGKPLYFAFRYHLQPMLDAAVDSRSRAVVSGFAINCVNPARHINETVVNNSSAGWSFVNIGYSDDDANYMPEASASYIYFNASTANTAERWSWAVSQAYTPDYSVNFGCDYAVGIKSFSDAPLNSYTYTYSEPGDYDAVFVASNVSADGTVKTIEKHIPIKVVERGAATIDNPGDAVQFSVGGRVRAAFSDDFSQLNWSEGDRVGIYAVKGSDAIGLNYPYSAQDVDGPSAGLAAVSSQWQYSYSATAGASFYAYAPFSGTAGDGNRFVVPVSIPSVQAQETAGDASHLAEYMILKSRPATIGADGGTVNLAFRNLTACVQLKLKSTSPCSFNIARVVLKGDAPLSFDRGNMLLEASPSDDASVFQVNDPADSVALNIKEPFRLETSAKSVYLTLMPGSHAAGSLKLELYTDNGYMAVAEIPSAVGFAGNGVYEREISVAPSAFKRTDGVVEDVYVWKPVTVASEVGEGDYFITFNYNYSGTKGVFALPCTPVTANPLPAPVSGLNLEFDSEARLLQAPDGYVWNISKVDGGWTISYTAEDLTYTLIACDQAQGLAISSDGTGKYSSTKTYSSVWKFSDLAGYGMQMAVGISTRRAVPWIDPANGLDHFEWRMAKADAGGYVFYKKTKAE